MAAMKPPDAYIVDVYATKVVKKLVMTKRILVFIQFLVFLYL